MQWSFCKLWQNFYCIFRCDLFQYFYKCPILKFVSNNLILYITAVYLRLCCLQVWPLTQFFLFPFCKKSMTPHRGNTILFRSCQPSNSLVSVSDPWRAFWADKAPFKCPPLALCVAFRPSEIQGHRQVCRARHEESKNSVKNSWRKPWLCVCRKRTFFTPILDCEKSTE